MLSISVWAQPVQTPPDIEIEVYPDEQPIGIWVRRYFEEEPFGLYTVKSRMGGSRIYKATDDPSIDFVSQIDYWKQRLLDPEGIPLAVVTISASYTGTTKWVSGTPMPWTGVYIINWEFILIRGISELPDLPEDLKGHWTIQYENGDEIDRNGFGSWPGFVPPP